MTAPRTLTKKEMQDGLLEGRTLTQEEWAHPDEIKDVNTLVKEGVATVTPWKYEDNFQCQVRWVTARS